jgi:hypothetical protein
MVTLLKLNTFKTEDQEFLYEVLKFRWSKANINIKYKHSEQLPSFEEHVKYINSGKFKKFYKIHLHEFPIGMIYIDVNNINGTFLLPDLLKKAIKNVDMSDIKDTLTAKIHSALFKDNPEVELHYATVNPNNTLSLKALLENGYEIVEHTLVFKTKNGLGQQGKWKGVDINW